jgi:glyoxylase I family protein
VKVSGIDHVGITTANVDRALGFYRDLLGMRVIDDVVLTSPDLAALLDVDTVEIRIADLDTGDGRILELLQYIQPEGRHVDYESRDPATAHVAFAIDDLEAVKEKISNAGGTVISRRPLTIDDPGGHFEGATVLYIRDPDGMILELVQRPSIP